jgi:O-antigen ligase
VFILFGYKARNAELAFILFFVSFYFFESKYSTSLRSTIFFMSSIFFIIFIFLINGFFTLDWNEISSGRLLSWNERINILISYDFGTLFFGQGYGADIMKTKQWWWDEKPSHNDFLSLIFNSGLLSFLLFIIIFYKLFKNANSFQKSLIIFIIITSTTNTGYLGRPIQFLYLIIIYLLSNTLSKKK